MVSIAVRHEQPITPPVLDVLRRAKQEVLGDAPLNIKFIAPEERAESPVLGLGVEGDVATLSPKQILSKGSALTDLIQALRLVLDIPDPHAYEYRVIENVSELGQLGRVVMFDIEVAGNINTDLPSETPIISMAFNDGEKILVVPEELCEEKFIADVLDDRTVTAHNGKFDMRTVTARLGKKHGYMLYPDHDTMLMHFAMNHGAKEHGLKPLAKKLFNAPDWEADAKKYTKGGAHYENIPRPLLYEYNAGDVYWTGKLYEKFRTQLEADPVRRALYHRLMALVHMLQDIEETGVAVDEAYLDRFGDQLTREIDENLDILASLTGNEDFNPGSWQQVKKFLEGQGNKVASTSEGDLTILRRKAETRTVEFIDALLDYRGKTKLNSTYVEGIKKRLREGVVYPSYNLQGTITGRLSSSNPNIQNIPRVEEGAEMNIRNALVAFPGEVILSVDYSQAELRTLAELTGDEAMIAAFQPGAVDYFDQMMPNAYPDKFESVLDFAEFKEAYKNEAKELRAKVKGVQYGCVTMDTKILTRRGWLTYDEVQPGDETPGIGGWTKVKEVVHYEGAPIEEFGNSRWSFKTTPNHRWATRSRQRVDGVRGYGDIKMKHQNEIVRDDIIEVADSVLDTHDDGLTDDEVAIISWILSDGHVNISDLTGRTSQGFSGQRRGITGYISQGKNPYVDEINALLANIPHAKDTQEGTNYPVYVWRLRSEYLRDLWGKAGLFDSTVQEFVLRLNSAHREIFLDVFWKAEGWTQGGVRAITQKRGDKAEAIMLAARLSGHRATMITHTKDICSILLNKVNYVTAQKVKRTDAGKADVWCVITESGTWTMRQGDYVAITGNTNYGRGIKAIAEALELSYQQAEQLIKGIYETYPGLKVWQDKVRRAVTDPKLDYMLVTPFGRRFQHEVVHSRNLNAVQNSALSFVPQSTANDICLNAALEVHKRAGQFDAKIVGLVHDAIYLSVPEDKAEECAKMVQTEMEGSAEQIFRRVKFETEATIGPSWGEV